jgi:hypothetical protein
MLGERGLALLFLLIDLLPIPRSRTRKVHQPKNREREVSFDGRDTIEFRA